MSKVCRGYIAKDVVSRDVNIAKDVLSRNGKIAFKS